MGLIDREIEGDLVEEAILFAKELLGGEAPSRDFIKNTSSHHTSPEEINIGHLSKKIDEIMNKAIYDGIKLPLDEALELESKLFGECILTEDMKIGLNNFLTNGSRTKAEFVHR